MNVISLAHQQDNRSRGRAPRGVGAKPSPMAVYTSVVLTAIAVQAVVS